MYKSLESVYHEQYGCQLLQERDLFVNLDPSLRSALKLMSTVAIMIRKNK